MGVGRVKVRITKEIVQAQNKALTIWDTEVSGLGVRVTKGGSKSWTLKYWSRPHQKQRWYTISPFGALTPTLARKKARELIVQIADGADPAQERKRVQKSATVNDLIDRYIREHLEIKNKPSTQGPVKYLIEGRLRPAFGKMKVEAVSRADISSLHARMSSTPRQANHALSILSKMFNLAELWGFRPENTNPIRLIERYKQKARDRFLSEAEINRLGKALDAATSVSPWTVAAIRFLLFSGMRRGEVLRLEWDWIDFKGGYIALPDAKAGSRIQPISDAALDVLTTLPRFNHLPYVFRNADGSEQLGFAALDSAWRNIRKRAKLDDFRLHDLRHTVGTYSGQTGANAFMVRDLLGHKTLAMTGRYVGRNVDPTRELANLVSDRINEAISSNSFT
jgi:integrase